MLWKVDPARPQALHEQIAANIRRAVADGTLEPAERLPSAQELAIVLQVNANTVLAAYRRLRSENLLEFRRGRGVRVRSGSVALASVTEAAHQLLEVGRRHGYGAHDLGILLAGLEGEQS
jgi:DNA-binding transcriptional regulator YhcF (GntR family)